MVASRHDGPPEVQDERSKTLAERAAWGWAGREGVALIVINPGLTLGPLLDARHGTSVGMVRREEPVAAILAELVDEAAAALGRRG